MSKTRCRDSTKTPRLCTQRVAAKTALCLGRLRVVALLEKGNADFCP